VAHLALLLAFAVLAGLHLAAWPGDARQRGGPQTRRRPPGRSRGDAVVVMPAASPKPEAHAGHRVPG